ncbi:SDR family NAD(P)-dependent oxidoreductase [Fibrella forsythiae]|uniref:SDR family NAD(P)-dependent oxidoreductase n=1 Tax=Fibrella forsythiae TaxID=2817061 RepID=A0ABS3JR31_9BACT|nr:SDR family NAD(P)-dependent oxidoreductase [Fibrella forsythiae]MBO0951826.1 SDR family NAD(P)-dependent oxidoreductase [Fibrella forsythiae]
METQNGKTALVTGATSGIGRELANLFAKDGYNLILVARSDDSLQQLAQSYELQFGVKTTLIAKDLASDKAGQEVYDEVKQQGLQVDVLVNNAGMGEYGMFATETDLQKEIDIIHINVIALVKLTKLFLKDMVDRNDGKILMLGSVASVIPNPLMAVYGATKSFIYSFSEALRNEIKDTNVSLTVLMPGATDTDFFNKAGASNTKAQEKARETPAADVAKTGYDALMSGKDKVVHGTANKASVAMAHLLPDSAVTSSSRRDMKSTNEEEESHSIAMSLGIAALAIAGLVVLSAWKTHNAAEREYDEARYRYKGNRLKNSASDKAASLKDNLADKASRLKDSVADKASSLTDSVTDKASSLRDGVADKVENLTGKARSSFGDLKDTVLHAVN